MWVYADREVDWCMGEQAERIAEDWRIASLLPPGLPRHALFVSMLIRAGMIWQAREDAAFKTRGCDNWPERDAPDKNLALACARLVRDSVASDMQNVVSVFPTDAFAVLAQDQRVLRTRIPEGYAFYDLYPEFIIAPAQTLPPGQGTFVLGLRSIGTSLAAMVASTVHTDHVATLRPGGEPFQRSIVTDDEWGAKMREANCVAIADEGPGLSGSSFASAGRAVRAVSSCPIIFMPTHAGDPGVAAIAGDRAAWVMADKKVIDRSIFESGPFHRADWFSDIVGPAQKATSLAGGTWRAQLGLPEYRWPAVDVMQERMKLLIDTESGQWLMKFNGLTPLSDKMFDDARHFADQGFGIMPVAERHGMVLWPWLDRARPLTIADKKQALPFIAMMLGFRARSWIVAEPGGSIDNLWDMARVNLTETFGDKAMRWLEPWQERLDDIAAHAVPVKIDGRLDCHEFMRLSEGALVKTDALDHHAAHDLIGCQDILWDVAGGIIEWSLNRHERADFIDAVEAAAGRSLARETLPFYVMTYGAFRLGGAIMAMEALSAVNPAESQRFRSRGRFYAEALAHHFSLDTTAQA